MNQQHHHFPQSLTLICASALLAFLATSCRQETLDTTSGETQSKSVPMRDIRREQVVVSRFLRSIETTGTVAFDQNRSTQVLSPISGPVTRILVGIGSHVGRGEALAIVSSPDFAAALSALRKADATARNSRRIAELDRQLFKTDAIARRDMEQAGGEHEAGAERHRVRQRGDFRTVGKAMEQSEHSGQRPSQPDRRAVSAGNRRAQRQHRQRDPELDRWLRHVEDREQRAKGHDSGKNDRKRRDHRTPQERSPQTDRNHRKQMIEA